MNDGPYTTWYENGQVKEEGHYRLGAIEGRVTLYHENGRKKAEGEYRKGRQVGAWSYWDQEGKPVSGVGQLGP